MIEVELLAFELVVGQVAEVEVLVAESLVVQC